MAHGPRGEKRPADVIGCAVAVARLSVGDAEETPSHPSGRVRSGHAGAEARSDALSPQRKQEIAKLAASARWR